eukprot:3749148-Ditylum_brightwellii.AAC.1
MTSLLTVSFFLVVHANFIVLAFHVSSRISNPTRKFISSGCVKNAQLFSNRMNIYQPQWKEVVPIFASSSPTLSSKAKKSSSYEERWLCSYNNLMKYYKENGNCLVPQTYPENPALGRWVRKQRSEYSLLQRGQVSRMTPERIELLEGLGFVWDANVATWNAQFDELRQYKEEHGHVNVPQSEGRLGRWVRNQRMQYSDRQSGEDGGDFLTKERQRHIQQLEELGFCWNINDANWMHKFESLKQFKEEFGHCNVPSQYKADMVLARWVLQVRLQYKNFNKTVITKKGDKKKSQARNTLTDERIKLLNSIGFVWDPNNAFWWEQFESLRAYKAEHGHCSVPQRYKHNPKLGNWVSNQRKLCQEYITAVSLMDGMGTNKEPLKIADK